MNNKILQLPYKLSAYLIIAISCILIASCNKATNQTNRNLIIIGASSTPHAEILEFVKPILAKQNIQLDIRPFNDYITPNTALAADELDANFFQHIPYLERTLKDHQGDPNYDFVNVGQVFIAPLGLYSTKHNSIANLPDKAQILTSSNTAERSRVVAIFVNLGLLKIKPGVALHKADYDDIIENPKQLRFKTDIEPALMPQIHKNGEGDIQIINSNFAIVAGLNPAQDPIFIEQKENNPYANIVVVRQKNADNPAIKKLIEALQLEETKQYMLEKFKGAIVPVL